MRSAIDYADLDMNEDLKITPDKAPEIPEEQKSVELKPEELDEVSGGKNEIGRGPG
jgi:hypothetical protein